MKFDWIKKIIPSDKTSSDKEVVPEKKFDSYVYAEQLFNEAYTAYSPELKRCIREWELFSGIDYSQYPKEVIDKFIADKRNLFQANFIRKKCEGLCGYILKNVWEFTYNNTELDTDKAIDTINKFMYSDKELLGWDDSFRQAILDGIIHVCIEEMYIDTTYDIFGRIGFRRRDPRTAIVDPNWVTSSSKDLNNLWFVSYLTLEELIELFPDKEREIKEVVSIYKPGFDSTVGATGRIDNIQNDRVGLFRVVEWHRLRRVKSYIYVTENGDTVLGDTEEERKAYMKKYNIDSKKVVKIPKIKKVYYITSFSPTLGNYVLQDKESPIQIGRLPFFMWSFCRINGRNSGLPSLIEQLQVTYNVRESEIDAFVTDLLFGNVMVDPSLFGDNMAAYKNFIDNINKPYQVFTVSPNTISSGREYIKQIRKNTDIYNLFQHQTNITNLIDRISKQPLVLEGISEGSEETGILYARKEARADTVLYTMYKEIENYITERSEAWFLLAKEMYSKVDRAMVFKGEKKYLKIEPEDTTILDRVKINVVRSSKSQSYKDIQREICFDILRTTGNALPSLIPQLVYYIISSLPISAEQLEKLKKLCDIETKISLVNAESTMTEVYTKKLQAALVRKQVESQLKQLQMQQAGEVMLQNNVPPEQQQLQMAGGENNMPQPEQQVEGNPVNELIQGGLNAE